MKKMIALMVVRFLLIAAAVSAGEAPRGFDHPWTDGAYSTITAPFCTGGVKPKNARWLKIQAEGMRSGICVRAVIQKGPAPVVVILNGLGGRADGAEASLWMAWLEQAGVHVLSFDSTFHPAMTTASRHGMAGNLVAEADLAARIINACLKSNNLSNKCTRVGVVGMSYGATQALLLGKLSREGRLPFRLDAVQAYSPPVSMADSLDILDETFTYEWKLTDHLWAFYNLQREYPVRQQHDSRMMRAAIARIFRMDLGNVVERNDSLFGAELDKAGVSRLLPKDAERDERMNYAEAVSFRQYLHHIAGPYWQHRGVDGPSELLAAGELSRLLAVTANSAEVILAANDPLNQPGAVDRLANLNVGNRLTILPRGGHLGYINADWTRAKLCGIFAPDAIAGQPPALVSAQNCTTR
jgi:predicted alpha/beta-fold hydrolase